MNPSAAAAAGTERQLGAHAVQAKMLERGARQQNHEEAGEGKRERPAVDEPAAVEAAITPHHDVAAQRDPPVRRQPEEIEQKVREPGTHDAAGVANGGVRGAVRPARIGSMEGEEDEREVGAERDERQPLGFAQQARELRGEGGSRFFRYAHRADLRRAILPHKQKPPPERGRVP